MELNKSQLDEDFPCDEELISCNKIFEMHIGYLIVNTTNGSTWLSLQKWHGKFVAYRIFEMLHISHLNLYLLENFTSYNESRFLCAKWLRKDENGVFSLLSNTLKCIYYLFLIYHNPYGCLNISYDHQHEKWCLICLVLQTP